MKYYILDINPEPIFPQVDNIEKIDVYQLITGRLPKELPLLNYKLENGVKATDILSQAEITATGLILNEKVKSIFKEFEFIKHRLFPISLQNITDTYYWFHLITDLAEIDWLDYSQSTFYRNEFGFREEDLSFNSYKNYLSKKKEINDMSTISIEKIKLNENFDSKKYDLFILPFLSGAIYISERLKAELEKKEISGIEIKEAIIS